MQKPFAAILTEKRTMLAPQSTGAWLASDVDVVLTTTLDTASAVISKAFKGEVGDGVLLQATRKPSVQSEGGRIFVNSFGTIHAVELAEGDM